MTRENIGVIPRSVRRTRPRNLAPLTLGLGRQYWLMTLSELVSQAGDHFRAITVTVFTFQLTNSILATAVQYIFASLPGVLFSGMSGQLADRIRPRSGLIVLSLISGLGTLAYIFANHLALILALNFALAGIRVSTGPIRGAWLRALVRREDITRANGIRGSLGGVFDLLFPIVTGIVIAVYGTKVGFVIDAVSFFLAALGFSLVHHTDRTLQAEPSPVGQRPITTDPSGAVLEAQGAWDFVRRRPDLLLLLVAYSLLVAGGQGVSAVFLPFLERTAGVGAEGFGAIISAYLLGNVLSGMFLARWGDRVSPYSILFLFTLGPVAWYLMSLTQSYWMIFSLTLGFGCVATGAVTFVHSAFQAAAPRYLTGRVFSVVLTWHFGAEVIGAIGGASLASTLGFGIAFRILAGVTIIGILAVTPPLRHRLRP